MAQGDVRNMTVLKLALVDDRHRVRPAGIMASMVAVVEVIVIEDTRVVVPAEGAPAAVVIAPVPMHPGRTPGMMGNPIPA